MNYTAYEARPLIAPIPGTDWHRVVRWIELGPCTDMADAKAKWGGFPVIERSRA